MSSHDLYFRAYLIVPTAKPNNLWNGAVSNPTPPIVKNNYTPNPYLRA